MADDPDSLHRSGRELADPVDEMAPGRGQRPSARPTSPAPDEGGEKTGLPGLAPAGLAVVRRPRDGDQADEWTLVLTAVGIPSRILRQSAPSGLALCVPPELAAAAVRTLAQYERESREGEDERPILPPERGSGALGAVVGLGLVLFERLTGFADQTSTPDSGWGSRWFSDGVANAARIRAGEWWRAVTAMTLHADVMHLAGNVVAALVFVGAAGRWLGWGVASLLMVAAAAAANVATAYVKPPDRQSLGASTVTFAALGLLVGLQVVHRWRGGGLARRRAWLVGFGAGLGLMAMLGMGQQSDVSAHAFSLGFGTLLGLGAGALMDGRRPGAPSAPPPEQALGGTPGAPQSARPPGWWPWADRLLALLVLAAVLAAWRRAWS